MKVKTEINDETITIILEAVDAVDKHIQNACNGATACKIEVNGGIKFVIDRPKRGIASSGNDDESTK